MSGRFARNAARPESPSGMAVTAKPSRSRASCVASRMTSSSSTNRTWVWSAIPVLSVLMKCWWSGRRAVQLSGTGVGTCPADLLYSLRTLLPGVNRPAFQLYGVTISPDGLEMGSPFS